MFLFIDNYDSFSYNLVQAFNELGQFPVVLKNDDPRLPDMALNKELKAVCISPGPGGPEDAGHCLDFIKRLPRHIPVLGVCLGHQALAYAAGAGIKLGRRVMHGRQSLITHNGSGLFRGLPASMAVGRYHSLMVDLSDNPLLEPCATDTDGELMAFCYRDRPWVGVQFHPESILTPHGKSLLANFPAALLSQEPMEVSFESIPEVPFKMAEVMESLAEGRDLDERQAGQAFARLMDGELTPSQAGALLLGLRGKGENSLEMAEAAKAVLKRAIKLPQKIKGPVIDVVGTGGDGKCSFNCSTATALMLAAMGHKVLKHGNRSVSSKAGSADALEQLGIPLHVLPEDVPGMLKRDNFVFLFAPDYHPAFSNIMPIRRELGVRTLFNLLGPLVNPARPTHYLLGVSRPEYLLLIARALASLNKEAIAAVVCGAGDYDELTPMGIAQMVIVERGVVRQAALNPAEYAFAFCSEADLAIKSPHEAGRVLKALLRGQGQPAMKDMLALNLGLALYLLNDAPKNCHPACGYDKNVMKECMAQAKQAVESGAGRHFAADYASD